MEEFEDLVPQPDEDGRMELTYRAWIEVDDVIWTMGRTLVFLDVSFNAIMDIPEEVRGTYPPLRILSIPSLCHIILYHSSATCTNSRSSTLLVTT